MRRKIREGSGWREEEERVDPGLASEAMASLLSYTASPIIYDENENYLKHIYSLCKNYKYWYVVYSISLVSSAPPLSVSVSLSLSR